MGGTLAFVESPAQLLNAVEWAAATDSDPRLIVLGPPEPVTRLQLHRLGDLVTKAGFRLEWAEVRGTSGASTLARYVREVSRADTVVLGDPYAAFSHLLLTAAPRTIRLVVVDDGTATVRYAEQWASGAELERWHVAHRSLSVRLVGARAARLLGRRSDRVELFSAMPLETDLPVIPNTYAWVREHFGPPAILPSTDLMGSSLVETGVVDADAYLNAIKHLVTVQNLARYLPHRHETPEKLATIERLGIAIIRPDLPMEIYARRGPIGRSILSFPSTVLHTLPLVLADVGVRIEALSVDDAWFTAAARSTERAFVRGI